MGVTFFESMSGELLDESGAAHRVVLDLRCDASHLTRFARTGRAAISGTARVEPWVDIAPCEGEIEIRPVRGRRVAYDVRFRDADGRQWRLHGRKTPSARHAIRSMTTLRAQLDCEGEQRAAGVLEFQMDDFVSYLLSWRVGSTVRPGRDSQAHDSLISEKPLDARERATYAAFAETVITPGGVVPAVDASTMARTEGLLTRLPPNVQLGARTGLRSLNMAARARHRKGFADLTAAQRGRILDRVRGTTPGAVLVIALGMPLKIAHFSRSDYLSGVGIEEPAPVAPKAPERWMSSVVTPEDLDERSTVECDVVVIGTGAGGATVAAALAEQGHGVVMMEEGRYFQRSDFAGSPVDRMLDMWREDSLSVGIGNAPIAVPVGRTVGGSTTVNSGVAIRTPDAVLQEWLDDGFPSDFRPESYGRWLDVVEAELGVVEGEPQYLGQVAEVVARGAEQMGARHGALPRNAPGCDGQGQCVLGCPTDAKRGANVSWVPRALRAGAGLYTGLPVSRLLMRGDRAVGLLASGQDHNGAPREVEVRAKAVVVAAGSLFTPLLLQRNGIRLPMLGRNLSIHPALGMVLRLPEDGTRPWRTIPMGYYVDSKVDELVKIEGFYLPPELAAGVFPIDGPELTGWMDDWGRVSQFGFMVRDEGVGRVTGGPGGKPLLRYSITPRVLQAFHRGSAELTEILLRGGATRVETQIAGIGAVSDIHSARAIASADLPARAFRSMGFHPLGTARLADSPAHGVVDFDHQVFGKRDLYVVDGSSVPTSLGVNPQMTIMSMALRAAEVIGARLDLASGQLPEPAGRTAVGSLQPA